MALDLTILKEFEVIFPAILVFVIVYGVLTKMEFFKAPGANATIALMLAILSATSSILVKTIAVAAPWFVLLVIFIVFMMFMFMIFGVKADTITGVVESTGAFSYVKMIFIIIFVGIFVASLGYVVMRSPAPADPLNGEPSVADTAMANQAFAVVTHPKVMGMAAVMLIMVFAATFLGGIAEKPR